MASFPNVANLKHIFPANFLFTSDAFADRMVKMNEDSTLPQELTRDLHFTDFKDRQLILKPTTYKHIKRSHPEIKDIVVFIADTLSTPSFIVESKANMENWIYHKEKELSKTLYKVVVIDIRQSRIKTAFITDSVKGGAVIWDRNLTSS